MALLKIYDGTQWIDVASAHQHDPTITGNLLSGGSTDGQVLVWRDSANAWSGETLSLVTAHSGLTDLQTSPEENTDHDGRYVPVFSAETPASPTPYSGMLWYDTDETAPATIAKQNHKKIIYVSNPVSGNSFPALSVPFDCTITRITHVVDSGTCVFNLQERSETTPWVAGNDIFTSSESATTTMSACTSFADATLSANTWLHFSASSVSSSPTGLWIGINFTED